MDTGLLLDTLLEMHRLETKTQCGALSIPLVHHHGSESDSRPGPLRTLRCTLEAGHDSNIPHKDQICCYSFKTFEDWQVVSRDPRTFDNCTCGKSWPCDTIVAMQTATEPHPSYLT